MLLRKQSEIIAKQALYPEAPLFNIGAVIEIRGPFEVARIRLADQLLMRDPALCTALSMQGHAPEFVTLSQCPEIGFVDFSGQPDALAKAQVWIEESLQNLFPFDGKTRLMRHALVRAAHDLHFFVGNYHHVAYDGWATSLIYQRLIMFYNNGACVHNNDNTLLPLPFETQLVEETAYRNSKTFVKDEAYWRKRLSNYDTLLLSNGPASALQAKRHSFSLTPERYQQLRDLANHVNGTVFHIMIGLTVTHLCRTFGVDDIILGLPILNRRTARAKVTYGLFASVLPFRVQLSASATFTELLTTIGQQLKSDFRHQRFPASSLLPNGMPYEASLSYEKHDYSGVFEGTQTSLSVLSSLAQEYPLKVFVREYDDARPVRIDLDYNFEAFSALDEAAFLDGFERLVDELIDAPTGRVRGSRAIQSAVDAAPITADVTTDLCTQFEAMAAQHGDAVAVSGDGVSLTYAQLDGLANRLAWRLREQGIGTGPQEDRVGLSVERGPALVIGILGILKAGGAYVPLDPAYPAERLHYLVSDSGIQAVVGDETGLAALSDAAQFTPILLDGETAAEAPPRHLHPQQAAYVIYTSGSTGQPKGCVVSHANVLRLFTATDHYNFGPKDVWSLFHSYAFDFSVWELWGALLHGGRVVVVPYLISRDPARFAALLEDEQVTVLSQTPAAFRQLLSVSDTRDYPALRLVTFGGEALVPSSLKRWHDRHGDRVRLVNMYGITETTVHVTEHTLRDEGLTQSTSVIGAPIADLSLQVLDRYGEPVPTGVAGELHVGGAGVTRGYLGRPGLTAQRFVPDAYGAPGARVYRSGDLGRRLPDGGLVYAGRADHQVKLRGFRIELGEIEAALRALNGVREAVVILDTPETGEPRLVGYVVGNAEPASLREALSQRLPVHMVPAILMPLDVLPLTAHGKVDTKALPAPNIHVSAGQAPRTEVEKTLAAIWSDILNIPTPSIDDNFFSLGGDSINSLQIVAKARAAGIAITLEQLFASPMLRPLALKVDAQVVPDQAPVVVPFELLSASDRARLPDGLDDALPLSRLQGGMLFHSNLEAGGSIFHDVFSFTLRLPWDEQAWRDAIEQLPSRHAALRTSFHWTEYSEPLQLIHSTGHTDYQLVDLRHLSAEARAAAVTHFLAEARQRPFDHRAGGLLRMALHRHTDDQVQLTLDFHHAIMDGWSVATLLTDLILMAAGQPTLPIPAGAELIADFVARERAAEADQTLQNAWRQRLADVEPMQWEAQTPEAATAARTVVRHHVPLPDALAKQVEACAAALGVSLKSVLLAVHLRVLAAVSGQDVVSTGYVTHGRSSQPDAVAGVGLFLNTLPLTLALRPSSWRALVQAVAAEERALQQVRQLPATSVKALSGGRTLYNVGFNFIHFHVYAHLQQLAQFELLDLDIFEETDFPLLAQYAKDPLDGSLALTLVRDPSAIDAAQVTLFAEEALNAFASLVAEYDAPWHTRAVPPSLPLVQTSSITTDLCTQFEAMAAQHGDAVAVSGDAVAVSGDGVSLTYAQLDGLANRLAWRLREQGIGTGPQEDRVGLSVERGPALVIGILGILKAGGAYVPLDPAYPAERLHYLVSDSGIQAVVGDETGLAALSDAAQFTPILLDGETAAEAPPRHLHPQQAAYIIYTSGSTGQPKGCVVSHANVLRLFTATDHYNFGPKDVWSLFHSYAFDFSVWELWGALLHGGRVVVVPYLISRDPARFAALLEDEQVTVLSQTPAAFRQLLSVSDARDYPALRLVTFGGEALVPSSLKRWHDRHGDRVRLVNMYGITETTVHVTEHTLRDEDLTQSTSVIGAPISDLSLQVLDRYGEPVPTGVAGELHVGGAGVTRGYLGRPGLTAQRFVPDAYGTPGARVYRSGDLGRRLPDGGLVYAGRADHQVKLRGFRIELGEIEAALRALNGVREAVVILDTPETGEPRLVGYVVGEGDASSLREALSQRLPVHMVPAILMPLDVLPLTAHGKVDTKALPAPEADIASLTEAEAPLPGLEQEIATLLGKVLKRPHVGRHQNFFTLGGDSIQATQLMFQLREHYHVDLPLRTLFEAETVAALAVEIEALIAARQHTATEAPAPMKRSRRRGATP